MRPDGGPGIRAVWLSILFTLALEIALYYLGFLWHGFGEGWGGSSHLDEFLNMLMWPYFLYGLLMNYSYLSGPLIYLLKITLMICLWRGALRRLRTS